MTGSSRDFQKRAVEEGPFAQEMAGTGKEWHFDVSGALSSDRAGLIR